MRFGMGIISKGLADIYDFMFRETTQLSQYLEDVTMTGHKS